MNTSDFEFFRALLEHKTGLAVASDKAFLLESRLLPVAKKWRCGDVSSLVITLRGLPDAGLQQDVIDALTLNDTSFLRESKVFRCLADKIIPDLVKTRSGGKRLRVWCAACSAGQEAYALAMLFKEKGLYAQGWKIDIVASDINTAQIERAKTGAYSQFEVQRGLPVKYLVENFTKEGQKWILNGDVKALVTLQRFNLLDSMNALGAFDLILCRNVLAHAVPAIQENILARLVRQATPKSYLLLGPQEKLNVPAPFQAVTPEIGLYKRP